MILNAMRVFVKNIFNVINKLIPKQERAIVVGYPNTESSAVSVANYICAHYKMPVLYVISNKASDHPSHLLMPGVRLIQRHGSYWHLFNFHLKYMRSKYLFFTHGSVFDSFPKTQVATNIWHGVLYKNVGLLDGRPGVAADVTVGTSALTRKMFASAFGVPAKSIILSGYPRNDQLIRASWNRSRIRRKLPPELGNYKRMIIWLPTYRERTFLYHREDGKEVGNPFYIPDFDLLQFDAVLKATGTLCLVKPHPMAIRYPAETVADQVLFIDDQWIADRHLTLYELVGCTDLLISDVSSIMIDYLLIDRPILCVSADFEHYKQSRGFYFEDIENWLPGDVLQTQEAFFHELAALLQGKADPHAAKRATLKKAFFAHDDARCTERLVKHVFNLQKS